MTNNLIRKGLAVCAGLSLATVGLVAAPAQAAPTALTIRPVAGDQGNTQNTVLGAQFLVATTAVGASGTEDVEYYITGADAADFEDIDFLDETALSALTQLDSTVDTGAIDNSKSGSLTSPATAALDANLDIAWTNGQFNVLALDLSTTAVTATTTITITPFVDNEVDNGVPDSNELTGNTLTITFNKASEVTATSVLQAVVAGAAENTMTAHVSLDKNINMASTVDGATVTFKENGTSVSPDRAAYWSVAKGVYIATSGASGNADKDAVYTAEPKVLGGTTAGSTTFVSPSTGSIETLSALAVSNGTSYASSGDVVRTIATGGSGTVTVSASVTVANLEAAAQLTGTLAGHTVYFKIAEKVENDFGTATITAAGSSVSDSTTALDSITVTAVTDATGEASLDISYTGLKAGNQFEVTPFAYGADLSTGAAKEFTGEDSVAKYLYPVDHVGGTTMSATAGTDPVAAINAGDSVSIRYRVTDQFGQTPAGSHRLNASLDGGSGTQTSSVVFDSAGFGTVTFADNSTTSNARTLTLDFDVLNADGVTWDNVSTATELGAEVYASATALKSPNRVTLSSTTTQALASISIRETALLANHDARFGNAVAVKNTESTLDDNVLSGVVYGTDGAVRPGAVVTLSAPDVMFVQYDGTVGDADQGEVYSYGSISVVADQSGRYGNIAYFSNVAGARTITATSGSASETVDVTFDNVGVSSGATWQITAPSTVQPGSTFSVTAKLVDKYGNAVDSEADDTDITYSGPGLVVGTLPTQTGADGTLKFSVLLGQNDSGTATITFDEHGADDSTTAADTVNPAGVGDKVDNITATVTITVGSEPVVQKVNAGSFKGYVAVYARGYEGQRLSAKIGKDWVIVDPIANNQENGTLFRVTDFTGAGVEITVRIYIDRVLTATIPLTTK